MSKSITNPTPRNAEQLRSDAIEHIPVLFEELKSAIDTLTELAIADAAAAEKFQSKLHELLHSASVVSVRADAYLKNRRETEEQTKRQAELSTSLLLDMERSGKHFSVDNEGRL